MITYHKGDATDPDLEGELAIVHILSTAGAYEKGFAKAVADRYPSARTRFKAWHAGDDASGTYRRFALGHIQWCAVGYDMPGRWPRHARWIVNMVAMRGLRSPSNPIPLDLDALDQCLGTLAEHARCPIVMPRIGCDLAGGKWDGEVGLLVDNHLADHDVHVYDLP